VPTSWQIAQQYLLTCLTEQLNATLPEAAGTDWWNVCVLPQLSAVQRDRVETEGLDRLEDLDLAALLNIFIRNWASVSEAAGLRHPLRGSLFNLKAARNRWAHMSVSSLDYKQLARDLSDAADVLEALGWPADQVAEVRAAEDRAMEQHLQARRGATDAGPAPDAGAAARPDAEAEAAMSELLRGTVSEGVRGQFAERTFVGIDFGTATTVASVIRLDPDSQGIVAEPLKLRQPLEHGNTIEDHLVPSCVALHRGRVLVGRGAADLRPELKEGVTVFTSFKMGLGVDLGPVFTWSKLDGSGGLPEIRRPQDAARVFLRWLREAIEAAVSDLGLPGDIGFAVSVPASFEANQRADLMTALSGAGYDTEKITLIDEPNAAFLGQIVQEGEGGPTFQAIEGDEKRLLVFDYGAGTCDVSILEVSRRGVAIKSRNLALSRFFARGGDDIDRAIVESVLKDQLQAEDAKPFEVKTQGQDGTVLKRLAPVAERLKVQCNKILETRDIRTLDAAARLNDTVSDHAIAPIAADVRNLSRGRGEAASRKTKLRLERPSISMAEFAKVMKPFVAAPGPAGDGGDAPSILEPVEDALAKAGLQAEDLHAVLFIGGSPLSPIVQTAVTEWCGRFVEPLIPRDMRVHVSRGAALHACLHHGAGVDLIRPIVSEPLSIITAGGAHHVFVEPGTPVPSPEIVVENALRVQRAGQRVVQLPVCSGTSDKLIGVLEVEAPSAQGFPAGESVELRCTIGADKRLQASARIGDQERSFSLLNPLANKELTQEERAMLRAQQRFAESALQNDGRPSTDVVLDYARAAQAAEAWQTAAELFEAAERLDRRLNLANTICFCWERADRESLALDWARIAYERRPSATSAFNLAVSYRNKGLASEAPALMEEALDHDPDHMPTLAAHGIDLDRKGDPRGRDLLERCVGLGTRLMDAGVADEDDLSRLLRAAEYLGRATTAKSARTRLQALKRGAPQPWSEENLARGEEIMTR
jgi:molecular chaperone DnaK (HSP70)